MDYWLTSVHQLQCDFDFGWESVESSVQEISVERELELGVQKSQENGNTTVYNRVESWVQEISVKTDSVMTHSPETSKGSPIVEYSVVKCYPDKIHYQATIIKKTLKTLFCVL
jgi:hypothetical protein